MPSVRVPEYELADLFAALEVWLLLDEGSATIREVGATPARLCSIPGAVSYYARLRTPRW